MAKLNLHPSSYASPVCPVSRGTFDQECFLEMMAPLGYQAHDSMTVVVSCPTICWTCQSFFLLRGLMELVGTPILDTPSPRFFLKCKLDNLGRGIVGAKVAKGFAESRSTLACK